MKAIKTEIALGMFAASCIATAAAAADAGGIMCQTLVDLTQLHDIVSIHVIDHTFPSDISFKLQSALYYHRYLQTGGGRCWSE